MDYFLELFGSLPRAGPGDDGSTRRALDMISGLPSKPRILDIGCGPGKQTVQLLKLTNGTVVAVDLLPQMILRVRQAAELAGHAGGLETVQVDMNEMAFQPASFDLIWSEGAIYLMGFQKGLDKIRSLVKPGGHVAVTEAVWLKADPPREVAAFWQAYPDIDSVDNKCNVISRSGYELVGHFVLPASSWTKEYYDPLAKRVTEYELKWQGVSQGQEVLAEARREIEMFSKYSSYYSYAFFVMQRPPAAMGSTPT